MNKVITINLNGNAYQVEEKGYQSLCEYLDAAEAQLRDNPDRAEIVSDLEQAIAEKCRNFLGPQKTIVTSVEIDRIIAEMGPVDSAPGDPDGDPPKTRRETEDSAKSGPNAPRRLYRIHEGEMIQGVCTGLAAYFGMDVTIVRLICVALAFASGGVVVLAYIAMWIIVPYAETSDDHAAAFGTQFNAQDFINQAKEHYADFKKDGQDWKRVAKEKKREWQQSWRRTIRNQRHWWGPVPPVPPSPLVGIMLPIFGVLVGVLSLIWVFAVISVVNTHAIFGWPLPVRFPVWGAILILLVVLQIVTGPFKTMRGARYGYGAGHGAAALFASLGWMALILFALWMAYAHVPEVHRFIQSLPYVWNEMVNR